jgi:hypothetical protein
MMIVAYILSIGNMYKKMSELYNGAATDED